MNLITQITDSPYQTMNVTLPDSTSFSLTIQFVPLQYSWVITNLTYNTFVLNGYKIVNSPNILHQWRNILPFGVSCYSNNNRDPSLQEDFSSGASILYTLDETEVNEVLSYFNTGVLS